HAQPLGQARLPGAGHALLGSARGRRARRLPGPGEPDEALLRGRPRRRLRLRRTGGRSHRLDRAGGDDHRPHRRRVPPGDGGDGQALGLTPWRLERLLVSHPREEIEATAARYVEVREQIDAGAKTWTDLMPVFPDDVVYIAPAWGRT